MNETGEACRRMMAGVTMDIALPNDDELVTHLLAIPVNYIIVIIVIIALH